MQGNLFQLYQKQKQKNTTKAQKIPTLPEHVRLEDVKDDAKNLSSVPIGILKHSLETMCIDMVSPVGNLVISNKVQNTKTLAKSLLTLFKHMKVGTILIDSINELSDQKANTSNYFSDKFDEVLDKLDTFVNSRMEQANPTGEVIICIYGLDKLTDFKYNLKEKAINKYGEKYPEIVIELNKKYDN